MRRAEVKGNPAEARGEGAGGSACLRLFLHLPFRMDPRVLKRALGSLALPVLVALCTLLVLRP